MGRENLVDAFGPKLTMAEFLEQAEVELQAFAAATRERVEAGDTAFTGPHIGRHTFDWFAEVSAYLKYVAFQEAINRGK
jgi:hypothetical protein